MAKKEFQAESKKLMDMMINSIYTNKEIFLRELISNASDAIDKLYYKSLTDTSVGMNKGDFRILLTRDKDSRTLTISDNGIGMTREELEQNLGTIAHSGSLDFKKDNKDENIDIIGQFGVGFYSAFMVADKVTVISKAYGSDEAWQWESSGADGYELEPAEKETAGTDIILHIKPDTETDNYDNFLDEYGIVAIVKKYSDYVRYPIQMEREKSRQKPEPDPKPDDYKPEWETYTELETLNSMVPIWKKQKSEVTDEEYANFYKDKFSDYADPARVIVSRTEGLKLIHNALEKKIKNELHAMLANDREKYESFWKEFGRQLKFGAYSDYGMHAELLRDLLLFWSAKEQKMVTLQEYVDKMPAEQKYIYFAAGDSTDRLAKLPAAELVMDKGYDVLLLTEDVDEFCLQIMRTYPRKDAEGKDGTVEFKNVNSGDLGLETEDEKKAAEEATTANKALFDAMKDALDGKVKEVKVSTRLKDHPVCLSADGPLSIEMEKVLSKQPGSEGVKSDKVLELNVNHPVFAVLKAAQEAGDTEKLKKYSALLYAQAQLIEGLPVDDPAAYAEAVCSLMQ